MHLRHRERLARAGDAEQHLVRIAALEPLDELADRARLIAGELEIGDEVEAVVQRGHRNPQSYYRGPTLDIGRGVHPGPPRLNHFGAPCATLKR